VRVRLIAVGSRMPKWVREAYEDYITRLGTALKVSLVEIEAGPHRITAAVTRDAVEELRLAPGVPATAAVKATSVMIERSAG